MTNREKAEAAWGTPMPYWIERLAAACDDASVRKVAAAIGVSPAMVSLAIRNCHHGPLEFIKDKTESLLDEPIVQCPVLGLICRKECRGNQQKPFSSINPIAVQLFRSCRGDCAYSELKKENKHGS